MCKHNTGVRHLIGLGAAVSLSACAMHSVAIQKHSSFYDCPEASVNAKDVEIAGSSRVQTDGCGKTEVFRCLAAKCRAGRILVTRHYSNATGCKHEDVVVSAPTNGDLGDYQVSGCGNTATYTCKESDGDLLTCAK